jgi:hypothetical protein
MTRTILNWSELLDRYKEGCEDNKSDLKKWSEMGEPEKRKIKVKLVSEGQDINFTELDKEFKLFKESVNDRQKVLDECNENNESGDNGKDIITDHNKNENKSAFLEIVYDCLMQDKDTLPAMLEAHNRNLNNRMDS